jgi:CheY-like chemotaxis protein
MNKPFALIVEGDPILGKIFEKTIADAGFDTALDTSGNQYISMLYTRHPVLVILDLNLPDNLGEQILIHLRNLYPVWALPLALVTADSFQASDLREQGETVLLKPIIPAQLLEIAYQIQETLKGSL